MVRGVALFFILSSGSSKTKGRYPHTTFWLRILFITALRRESLDSMSFSLSWNAHDGGCHAASCTLYTCVPTTTTITHTVISRLLCIRCIADGSGCLLGWEGVGWVLGGWNGKGMGRVVGKGRGLGCIVVIVNACSLQAGSLWERLNWRCSQTNSGASVTLSCVVCCDWTGS
ncbi:hypothetical protein B0T16DRAFT_176582 [Cercophora newfieldiana]|uniref:Secreted protein n=1 Tax=Cercophora newfieldiana TaxID=92897 RepID=A0AA39Y0V9_9PEZI|nr:hypothetical protein B0T16DRAFT_176582 [Cercophora newfieldiana]